MSEVYWHTDNTDIVEKDGEDLVIWHDLIDDTVHDGAYWQVTYRHKGDYWLVMHKNRGDLGQYIPKHIMTEQQLREELRLNYLLTRGER
jgi:hypothetical protein